MTKAEADALLKAFLAAKKAGQEELWRETHPEAPDGPTVLIVWLMAMKRNNHPDLSNFRTALAAVDNRCALRMAIYAAIVVYPLWDNYCDKISEKHRAAPLAAIRAAIACYRDPTANNRRAADVAAEAARAAAYSAAYAAFHAAAYAAAEAAARAAAHAARAALVGEALGDAGKVINAMIAAIADHYEGRPLEMP